MSSELIFVTGASGFLGCHVVLQLLEKGYRVRGAARGAKADYLKTTYASYGDRFEGIKITDITHDQFPDALKGVDAIIHTASPLPRSADPETVFSSAIDGTLNVIVQGEKAGVKRMVVTSSIATVWTDSMTFSDKNWNPLTKQLALDSKDPVAIYSASKVLAEQALWDWAEKHPHVEVTTLNPTFFFGPFTPHFPLPTPDYSLISTDTIPYNFLFKDGVFPPITSYIDVRDVAKAHLAALKSPPASRVGRKRVVLSSPHGWAHQKVVDFIKEKRPQLQDRMIEAEPADFPWDVLPMDFARVEEVLGMKKGDFFTIEETYLDTIDALVEAEEGWRNAGHAIKTPPSFQ
ncbi:epimerase domain-containing protein [Favolaschia claudopus]|uniref:Epimerase domain-containing protein n=1 Tax=Favolaschia claudopus TaxID=2862362 RepID=A0AAW0E5I8_9AGAR